MKKSRRSPGLLGAFLVGALLLPGSLSAQSSLDTAQAQAFLGTWVISLSSDMGQLNMDLQVRDQGGKLAVSIGAPEMGGMQDVSDVSRSEQYLVLEYMANAQGQSFPVAVSLAPNGADLDVFFDVAQGQFTAQGTAKKAAS